MRLPLADRVLYATGSLGNATLFWAMSAWLIYFYSPPAESGLPRLMPVAVVGLALAAGRFIEAFDDPLIGWWSDRTRSRWGRRIPFLLVGTPALALTFWLLWRPPDPGETLLNGLYFFIALELFFLASTVVQAPYEALQAEIASSSRDRVSMGAWKVFFGSAGAGIALVATPLMISQLGFPGMAVILALLALISLWLTLFGLWSRGTLSKPSPAAAAGAAETAPPFFGSVRDLLAHGPFRALAASFVLFSVGYTLLIQLLPFYVSVVLRAPESDVARYSAGVIAVLLLTLPALSRLSAALGKKRVYALAMLGLGIYLPLLGITAFDPVVPGVDLTVQSAVVIWATGLGFGALFVFPGALMADVVDDDARRSGHARAAIFYGLLKTLEKFAFALAAGIFGVILQVFGYSSEQPLGLRLVLPAAGMCVFAGFIAFQAGYRLREDLFLREPALAPRT